MQVFLSIFLAVLVSFLLWLAYQWIVVHRQEEERKRKEKEAMLLAEIMELNRVLDERNMRKLEAYVYKYRQDRMNEFGKLHEKSPLQVSAMVSTKLFTEEPC